MEITIHSKQTKKNKNKNENNNTLPKPANKKRKNIMDREETSNDFFIVYLAQIQIIVLLLTTKMEKKIRLGYVKEQLRSCKHDFKCWIEKITSEVEDQVIK